MLLLAQLAHATIATPPEKAELYSRTVKYVLDYTINADGTSVETTAWTSRVLKEKALEGMRQQSVSFSTSTQTGEMLEAYTLKADGRRIDAPRSNYQIEANSGRDKDAPAFSDTTTLTVIFPELAVGDSIVFSWRLVTKTPIYPGHFSEVITLSPRRAYDDVQIRINAPLSLWTQYQARQLKEVRNEKRDGRQWLEWTWSNPEPLRSTRRDYSVRDLDQEPGLSFTTFRSYAEVAEAYGRGARPRAAVTPRVQKLADDISKGHSTTRDIARALYEWVALNISYAGNCIGMGAVVPRELDFVLDNQMGDCKDHATLLQALLSARGIDSTQALINAGDAWTLPQLPVVSMVNHVITYIPALDLYLDSTSDSTPFGMLPFSDRGKPVLLVDGYRADSRTPLPSSLSSQRMKTRVIVDRNGNVQSQMQVTLNGDVAVQARSRYRDFSAERERDLVKRVLQSSGWRGTGSMQRDDAAALLDSYSWKVDFSVEDMVAMPGPGAFAIYPLFATPLPVYSFTSDVADDVEAVATTCAGGRSEEEYEYRFPPGMKILGIPDAMELREGPLRYRASYRLRGRTLQVSRLVENSNLNVVCTPAMNAAWQAFAKKIQPNLRGQVVYKRVGP